jgi:hypothetical protein
MVNRAASTAAIAQPPKRTLRARVIHELSEFVVMFLYLLIPIGAIVVHRAITLKQMGFDYRFSGVAIVTALVLAKVMVVAEGLGLGGRWNDRPLIWPILVKSVLFAVLLILFYDLEGGVEGLVHGKRFIESIPPLGGGGALGVSVMTINLAIALIPFFAYRELSRAMGPGKLRALLFRPRDS